MGWSASTKMPKSKPKKKVAAPEARTEVPPPRSIDGVLESLGLQPKPGPSVYGLPGTDGVCVMGDRVELFLNPG